MVGKVRRQIKVIENLLFLSTGCLLCSVIIITSSLENHKKLGLHSGPIAF